MHICSLSPLSINPTSAILTFQYPARLLAPALTRPKIEAQPSYYLRKYQSAVHSNLLSYLLHQFWKTLIPMMMSFTEVHLIVTFGSCTIDVCQQSFQHCVEMQEIVLLYLWVHKFQRCIVSHIAASRESASWRQFDSELSGALPGFS